MSEHDKPSQIIMWRKHVPGKHIPEAFGDLVSLDARTLAEMDRMAEARLWRVLWPVVALAWIVFLSGLLCAAAWLAVEYG